MSDKLPPNFDHKRAGTVRTEDIEDQCRFCHEVDCVCDKGERL